MGTSIFFEGNYILVGDLMYNISVLWVGDQETLAKEKAEGKILLRKMHGNNSLAHIVGISALKNRPSQYEGDLTEFEKESFGLLSASAEGYLRIY